MIKLFIYIILIIGLIAIIGWFFYFYQGPMGRLPQGERANRIKLSPYFNNGSFQNLENTPALSEDASMGKMIKDFLFTSPQNAEPNHPISTQKSNISDLLKSGKNGLIWLGHSSYLLYFQKKVFLIDPVMGGSVSPIPGFMKSFAGTDIYNMDEIPAIDFLIITHDHYDHLDYKTIMALQDRVSHIIVPLGVGEHFEYWGLGDKLFYEGQWGDSVTLDDNIKLHFTPARHFSGRGFKRNQSLWTSYVLTSSEGNVFLGGDSGYGQHFKSIGNQFGPFHWAILENGQYNKDWKYIHALPEEQNKIIADLKANNVLTVHHSKFKLAYHEWQEPLETIYEMAFNNSISLATPLIGQIVYLDSTPTAHPWWREGYKK